MKDQAFTIKIRNATIWSTVTQLIIKLFSPFTNMILARLLVPETFGVIAAVSIVLSFTDIFLDSGFPKYLIQHEFRDMAEEKDSANAAFWSNFAVAILLWVLIIILRQPIAAVIGHPDLDYVIAIACVQIPINALPGIQTALFARSFNYKDLFLIKLIAALIPFFVTIPFAYVGMRHWSIIIGSTCGIVFSTIMLTIKSKWRPAFSFNRKLLKEMLSFSSWSMVEGFFIWLTTWVDIIIIGNVFSDYYLGLYITSYNMINALMSMITCAVAPILFAALSRMQNDRILFYFTFLKYQKLIAYFMFPIGIGIYLYRDFATAIILGKNWMEASDIIGICALTSAIKITLVNINSEAFKSIGQPKLSLFLQVLDLCILLPVCIISTHYGFWPLVYARALARFDLIIPCLIFINHILKYRIRKLIQNISIPIVCTFAMTLVAIGLRLINTGMLWQFLSIIICAVFYSVTISLFDINISYKFYTLYNKRKYK